MRRLRNDDRGQTIFLAPIGFIIVLLLGGVTLEVGNLHLRQRQLDNLADSVASNAAGAGFDIDHFRESCETTCEIRVNVASTTTTNIVNQSIMSSNFAPASVTVVRVEPVGAPDPGVVVDLAYTHDFVFGRQILGLSQTLTAQGNATLLTSEP